MSRYRKLRLDQLHKRYSILLKYLAVVHDAHTYWSWDPAANELSIYVAGRSDPDTPEEADPLAPIVDDLDLEIGEAILEFGGSLSATTTSYFLMPSIALAVVERLAGVVRLPHLPKRGVIELDAYGGVIGQDWCYP